MTGTVRNSPDEIRLILRLYKEGLTNTEIAARCNQQWKHRVREVSSVKYIINTYKKNPE